MCSVGVDATRGTGLGMDNVNGLIFRRRHCLPKHRVFSRMISRSWLMLYLLIYVFISYNHSTRYLNQRAMFITRLLLLAAMLVTNVGIVAAEASDEDCEKWAASGECSLNPKYMLANCVVACEKQAALNMALAQEIGKTIAPITRCYSKKISISSSIHY